MGWTTRRPGGSLWRGGGGASRDWDSDRSRGEIPDTPSRSEPLVGVGSVGDWDLDGGGVEVPDTRFRRKPLTGAEVGLGGTRNLRRVVARTQEGAR